MAKSYNQKIKLLFLMDLFWKRTDSEHTISMKEILNELEKNGISGARKSVYSDIETLKEYGMDIEYRKEHPEGYYLADRAFELVELKLLVDAVQSSKFITEKKSRSLIQKLGSLTSDYEAKQLKRQVYVADRIKTMNESIYYNVDKIHSAISGNVQIVFEYTRWGMKGKLELLNKEKIYRISPWMMSWTDENYYLVGYDSNESKIKHFRVDKMIHIDIVKEKREGKEEFKKIDPAVYSKNMFGMFSGEEQMLDICIPEHLLGVFVDRFGKEISVRKAEEGKYIIHIAVIISEPFFGWLTGLGKEVIIRSPQKVVQEYQDYIKRILEGYK